MNRLPLHVLMESPSFQSVLAMLWFTLFTNNVVVNSHQHSKSGMIRALQSKSTVLPRVFHISMTIWVISWTGVCVHSGQWPVACTYKITHPKSHPWALMELSSLISNCRWGVWSLQHPSTVCTASPCSWGLQVLLCHQPVPSSFLRMCPLCLTMTNEWFSICLNLPHPIPPHFPC